MSTSFLIVEDSEDDTLLLLRHLKRGGYTPQHLRVDTREDMRAALERQSWDIILSDHNMPRFDALAAIGLAKEFEIPLIVVSGNVGEELAVATMRAGASDFILKSDLTRLCQAIERTLREASSRKAQARAEAALRESEERFALAVRGSQDAIWDWNLVADTIYHSPRFAEMLGFSADEIGTNREAVERLIHKDDLPAVRAAILEHLARRGPYDVEYRMQTRIGEQIWVRARGQALWDEQGKPIRMAGSLSDLTASKRAEAALKEQLELIGRQKDAIRALSLPIIEVWEGVLTVPVLGALDATRTAEMIESLLSAVTRTRCQQVILDLTGIQSIDADTAGHIVRLVDAVALLGAQGKVVGIQPDVARAIVSLGVDLSRVRTLANLREALRECIKLDRPFAPKVRALPRHIGSRGE